ncbi:hypothetical protein A2U01_0069798, partial [Trifolium medium]|nr:hypothetical protein [Trifolium medium]
MFAVAACEGRESIGVRVIMEGKLERFSICCKAVLCATAANRATGDGKTLIS